MGSGHRYRLALLLLASSPFAASPSQAAPCAGFTDVDSTSVFCKNVEWLKNRAITTGCTTNTLYCPGETVSRAQMSLFLNRLGNALTTTNLNFGNSGSGIDIDTSPVLNCGTPITVPGHPRSAHGIATLLAYPSAATSMDLAIGFVESTDNGSTWSPVSPLSAWSSNGSGAHKSLVVLLPPRDLAAGGSYRWAIRVSRVAGSTTTGDIGGWTCLGRVRVENRITASSPFDDVD